MAQEVWEADETSESDVGQEDIEQYLGAWAAARGLTLRRPELNAWPAI